MQQIAERARWYWQRLRSMTPIELVQRLGHFARISDWRLRRAWPLPVMAPVTRPAAAWDPVALLSERDRRAVLEEAERYLAGSYCLLNISFTESPIDWRRDPQTGRTSDLAFAFDVPHRDPGRVGNVKNIWEKNRHHHLTLLAVAYRLTGDARFSREIVIQMSSWVQQNPVLRGVNWASSLELGIRLISWIWIERLLRSSDEHEALFGDKGLLWGVIYWHQKVIAGHMSVGSSANNHLIGEASGLYMASRAWPCFPESTAWQAMGKTVLEEQAIAQTFPEGLNRELAFGYHLFVLEFLLLSFADSAGTLDVRNVVTQMLGALRLVTDVGGNLPRYGDDDEGMAVQLRPLASSRIEWLHAVAQAHGFSADSRAKASVGFEQAGIYILRAASRRDTELFCLVDAGPLGYLSLAAHGHSDALSFTMSHAGVPVFVDSGTYAYHVEPKWRTYFRGTGAHNTVMIDGADQSIQAGRFLWKSRAQTRVLSWHSQPNPSLVAEHDGYTRLRGRPVHRRGFLLSADGLEIRDHLLGGGWHAVEWRFHLAPDCTAALRNGACELEPACRGSNIRSRFRLALDTRVDWGLSRGLAGVGWYSSKFNHLEPTTALIGRAHVQLPFVVTFQITLE